MSLLFEAVLSDDKHLKQLASRFKNDLGLYVKLPDEGGALDVADNSDFDYFWKSPAHTGLFLRTRFDEASRGYIVHVNSLVVAKSDRGKGLGKKLVSMIVEEFGEDLSAIEISDESMGFWEHIEELFPSLRIVYEDCQD
jgi:GNAT superfamily N-acetyltransferase